MGFPFSPTPPPLKKVKLFIYGAIFLEFETQHLHMFTNNTLQKKVKLFIYGAIFLEFETQHLHMFTNNTLQ